MPAFGRELTETERLYRASIEREGRKESRRAGEARAVEAGQPRACRGAANLGEDQKEIRTRLGAAR